MIWQDYKKLYSNALKQYSPKFKKELQKQVDTYCRTQDYNAISDKAIKKTIKQLHSALGTKMAGIAYKDVKKGTKGYYAYEFKSAQSDLWLYTILQFLERQGLEMLAYDITETTKNQIKSFLAKGFEDNLTMNELIPLLKTSGITDYRAELIARTETGRAANIGSMVGATSTGLVTVKEWIAAKDNRTRRIPRDYADHLHMDGKQVPMDANFEVSTKRGIEYMLHPADSKASAANVCNCRCTLGYEAQRDSSGKPLRLENNPPKGDVGFIWNTLTNVVGMQIGNLITRALVD